MQTKLEIQIEPKLHFKSNEIEDSLQKNGVYKSGTITLYQLLEFDQYIPQEEYIPPEEDYVFAMENKDENLPFIGVVNFNFERFGYCLNTYINGDIYFGFYYKDIINKKGLYSYKPQIQNEFKLSQYYLGEWKNNLLEGKGIYLWIKDHVDNTASFNEFINPTFDAFVGVSEKGLFKKGVLLKYIDNNFLMYYGGFSPEGKKEGNSCFYYSNKLDKICYGTYKDNIFIEGFVGKFNEGGKLCDLIIYKKDENKTHSEGEKLKINEYKNIENIMTNFRKIILSKNYFKMIYEEFDKVLKFRDEKMKNINILTENKYGEIVELFESNKISLYEDIAKNMG